MEFFHPAMWHVALGSWHWIRQVAARCNVARSSRMTCHWIRPNVRHIGILLPVSMSIISPQSTCYSAPVCEILSKSNRPRQKNYVMSILKMNFRSPIMGSLKSPCATSYRSSIETIALNCLVLRKIAFLHFGDRQTDRQTNRRTNR